MLSAESSGLAPPDAVSFGTVVACWASSGMKVHAVERAEALADQMRRCGLAPNAVVWNSVMSAWVKSRDPRAVGRTAEILALMEAAAAGRQDDVGEEAYPDLVSYNTHLHALSIHASPSNDNAERADQLLRRMEEGIRLQTAAAGNRAAEPVDLGIAPNAFSYNAVIDAYARSNQGMMAAHALRRLVRRRDVDGLEPDAFSFNRVLAALAAGATAAAAATASPAAREKVERQVDVAEKLLWYMDDTHASGVHARARPDAASFATVIHAHAKLANPERAQRLLDAMKDDSRRPWLKPTTYCYNAVISAWAASGGGLVAARRAEALLEEMQAAGLAPNSHTYNAVLKCWAASGTRCCGKKAELYLERMWDLYHSGNPKVEPNDFSYNTVRTAPEL
jgi:hypothetical protein